MNRKLLGLAALGLAIAITAGVAQTLGQPGPAAVAPAAASAARHPIAVLDLVRVFNECAQIKDLNEMIGRQKDEVTKEASQRKEVIDNKQVELSAFQPGKPDYETRRKELTRLNVEANVWLKMQEDDLERQKFEWTRIIYERAIVTSGELAKEQGFDVVLQRVEFKPTEIDQTVQTLRRLLQDRVVIYNVPEIDLTDVVIRRLDAQYSATGGKKQVTPQDQSSPQAAPGPKPDAAGFLWQDGYLEKQYPVAAGDVNNAIDAVFAKCSAIDTTPLEGNKGSIRRFGVGDKSGKYRTADGATWSGIATIKEIGIKDGGVCVSVKTLATEKAMTVGFKIGDGDRKSSEALHKLLAEKLAKAPPP